MAILTMQELAFVFGLLGNVVSFMVFLAPVPTFYRIYKKKSTEGFQSIPYVVALFSATLLLYYAFLKTNGLMLITINSIGCIIEIVYLIMYLVYAPRHAKIYTVKLIFGCNIAVYGVLILSTLLLAKGAKRLMITGWICGAFSVSVYAAPLSIMRQVIRTKSVEYMPFSLSFFLTLCAIMWFFYGLLIRDFYIALPNVLGFAFGIVQMILYIVYKDAKKDYRSDVKQHGKGMDIELNTGENPKAYSNDHQPNVTEMNRGICKGSNVVSFMLFLAPVPSFYRIYKKKSTEGLQSIPYVVALFSATLLLYYAFLKTNGLMLITINSIYRMHHGNCIPDNVLDLYNQADIRVQHRGVRSSHTIYAPPRKGSQETYDHWVDLRGLLCQRICCSSKHHEASDKNKERRVHAILIVLLPHPLRHHVLPNVLGFAFGIIQMISYIVYKDTKKDDRSDVKQHGKGMDIELNTGENPKAYSNDHQPNITEMNRGICKGSEYNV
ncbi:hypothetical protein HHK36_001923 [Tetracentron sinense]|uniref:Bidirectional sugar transporter SWEET n=1 Tax=Tetracentron sinense TaxID=13715 RepID=A0A835DVH7_TETSI|nr:hypothetical protein HHK36_001923 [Tetracentron sinense]